MHLKSTVYDWFTIGDRVSEQSRQLQPAHELVRGCQLGPRCHSEVRRKWLCVDLAERERRWVLLKIPRCDIDGVGEGK